LLQKLLKEASASSNHFPSIRQPTSSSSHVSVAVTAVTAQVVVPSIAARIPTASSVVAAAKVVGPRAPGMMNTKSPVIVSNQQQLYSTMVVHTRPMAITALLAQGQTPPPTPLPKLASSIADPSSSSNSIPQVTSILQPSNRLTILSSESSLPLPTKKRHVSSITGDNSVNEIEKSHAPTAKRARMMLQPASSSINGAVGSKVSTLKAAPGPSKIIDLSEDE
jgi:hypothetical protein